MQTISYKDRVRGLERRRLKAGRLFALGKTQTYVAPHFNVSSAAACQWHAAWKADTEDGLKSTGPSGILPRLDEKQKRLLKQEILRGPVKAGYATDFWTLERIRVLAKKKLKVELGTTSVWRTVVSLGFSVQKPERRARERDERAIADWKLTTFPQLKKMGQEPRFSPGI